MIVRLAKTLVLIVALAASAPVLAADYVSTVTGTNPLAYWRLDATNQASTNGLYSTTYTNVATSAAGSGAPIAADPGNRAASFDGLGSNSIINTGLSGMVPAKGSINAWINLSSLASTAGRTFYIAGESEFGNDFDFQIDADNQLRFYTGSGENTAASLGASPLGQWLMVTASYDATLGASSYRNVYVNGVLAGSYVGGVATGTKSSQFTIGYSAVFGDREFSGLIDEVGVWNRGLSTSEVGALYASRLTPATPGAVPEPATWAMMIGGLGLIGGAMRNRRRKVAVNFS